MDSALTVGDAAPDFTTTTDTGETFSLKDLRGRKVVLYFYPADDTPGCTAQACGFRDSHADFDAKGAAVFGVSPDSESSHAAFRGKYGLPFTLLVDEDNAIAEAYGVWAERTWQGRSFMGVVRSHFVIDEEGKLIDARIDVSPEDGPLEALAALTATR